MNKTRWIRIGLALSVAFNCAVLGALGYRLWERRAVKDRSEHHILMHHPGMGRDIRVDLKPGQKNRLRIKRDIFNPRMDSMRTAIHSARVELARMLRKDTVDMDSIDVQIDQIGVLQTQMEKEVVRQMLREKNELAPEQQKLYMDFVTAHLGLKRPHCIPGDGRVMKRIIVKEMNGRVQHIETETENETRRKHHE